MVEEPGRISGGSSGGGADTPRTASEDERSGGDTGFVEGLADSATDIGEGAVEAGEGALEAGADVSRTAAETTNNIGESAVETGRDIGQGTVETTQEGIDRFQSGADEVVSYATGGRVGVSQDWTSPDDFQEHDAISDDWTSAEDTLGEGGAFGEEGVSPSTRMSLQDPEAIEARAEKEQEILESRDDGVLAGIGAGMFGTGQMIERGVTETGGAITDTFGFEVGPKIGDEHLGEVPANVAGGGTMFLGTGLGAGLQAPASAAHDIQTTLEGGETPTDVEGGTADIAANFGETQVDMATDYPMSTAAGFLLPGGQTVAGGVRGMRATRGTEGTVRWDEITTERGAEGDLPQFETDPNAPTTRAVSELEESMADQPDLVQDVTGGEGAVFHSTTSDFGRRMEVGEGASELPGLFASPEASPLGLNRFGASEGRSSLGFGDYSLQEGRVPAFETRNIEGMPRGTGESGYAVRDPSGEVVETGLSRAEANRIADDIGGERATDPTTSGYEYLTEEAPTETGMVRPEGSRTTEMETIIPPESEFGQTSAIGVELPDGRTIRSEVYRPAGEPARGGGEARAGDADAQPTTAGEISETATSPSTQPDYTVESTFGVPASAGSGMDGYTEMTESANSDTTSRDNYGSQPEVSIPFESFNETRGGETDTAEPTEVVTDSPSYGEPTSTAPPTTTETAPPTRDPSGPPTVTDAPPTYGSPTTPSGPPADPSDPPRRPRGRGDEDYEDEEVVFVEEEVAPLTTPFTNPIASVFDGVIGGSDVASQDSGEPLGPFE